jgi:hypothetical protein
MTEYHCWVNISHHHYDTNSDLRNKHVALCERYLATHPYLKEELYKIVKYNGMVTFLASGLHNHNDGYILEVFTWLGENAPGSYGLLYYQDDENSDMETGFRTYIMKKGKVIEKMDDLLSPRIPNIEDETD